MTKLTILWAYASLGCALFATSLPVALVILNKLNDNKQKER